MVRLRNATGKGGSPRPPRKSPQKEWEEELRSPKQKEDWQRIKPPFTPVGAKKELDLDHSTPAPRTTISRFSIPKFWTTGGEKGIVDGPEAYGKLPQRMDGMDLLQDAEVAKSVKTQMRAWHDRMDLDRYISSKKPDELTKKRYKEAVKRGKATRNINKKLSKPQEQMVQRLSEKKKYYDDEDSEEEEKRRKMMKAAGLDPDEDLDSDGDSPIKFGLKDEDSPEKKAKGKEKKGIKFISLY